MNARKSLENKAFKAFPATTFAIPAPSSACGAIRTPGDDLDRAQEKLRVYFGWSKDSQMPRLYARAYFETRLAEVWNEKFDQFIDALRRAAPEKL